MPEQPQWSERTLDMPPQDPWAEPPTVPAGYTPPGAGAPQPDPPSPFSQGRARVSPHGGAAGHEHTAVHEPTGTGWPGADAPSGHRGMTWRWSELRRGGEWTSAAVLFAFVCWGIWAISGGGPLGTPAIVFAVTLIVAAGVFCLSRVVGYFVLERSMGRTRRTARGSHLVTAVFLAVVGVGYLRQTEWVVTAWNWVAAQVS